MQRFAYDDKHEKFFTEIVRVFKHNLLPCTIKFIVVGHTLPTSPDFLKFLNDPAYNFSIGGIILKSSTKNPDIQQLFDKEYKIIDTDRDKLKNKGEATRVIHDCVADGEKCIIIDIGGYFAPCLEELSSNKTIQRKLLGVVEDTENGHQKYQNTIASSIYPIYSVARSLTKRTEDYNIGKSIVSATESLARKYLNKRLEDFTTIGVIGFGKIGSSIAEHVRGKHIRVLVYDRDPTVLLYANSLDFDVCDKDTILRESSLIFCATGNKSLSVSDLTKLANDNVVISSCTSADDEFNLDGMPDARYKDQRGRYSLYQFENGATLRNVYLLVNGNAVNFTYNAIVGDYIRGVQAAILVCALKLYPEHLVTLEKSKQTKILTLDPKEETTISRVWLHQYKKIKFGLIENLSNPSQVIVARKQMTTELYSHLFGRISHHSFITSNSLVLVYGNKGNGKTELVRSYANSHRELYDLIWWVDCEHGKDEMYVQLAAQLNVSKELEFNKLMEAIIDKLVNLTNFLIIYDNADKGDGLKEIKHLLEKVGGRKHIILISEQPDNASLVDVLKNESLVKRMQVGNFTDEEATQLMRERKVDQENGQQLAKQLDRHPLVLHQAITCLTGFSGQISVADYSEALRASEHKTTGIDNQQLIKVIEIAIQCIQKDLSASNINKELLDKFFIFLIYLNNINISETLLKGWLLEQHCQNNLSDKIIQLLFKAGILSKNDNGTYSIHKQVQVAIKLHYSNLLNLIKNGLVTAIEVIGKIFQYDYYSKRSDSQNLLDAVFLLDLINKDNTLLEYVKVNCKDKYIAILKKLGSYYLNEVRNYEKSRFYYQKALELNPKDPGAILYVVTNDYLLAKSKSEFSPESLGLLQVSCEHAIGLLSNVPNYIARCELIGAYITLSYIHKYQNQLGKSKQALEEATQLRVALSANKQFPQENIQRVDSLLQHAYGGVYYLLGKEEKDNEQARHYFSQAEEAFNMAINIRSALGQDHPDLARTRQKLSQTLFMLGRLDEAEKECRMAIKTQLKILTRDHLNLAESKKTLENIQKAKSEKRTSQISPSEKAAQSKYKTNATSLIEEGKPVLTPDQPNKEDEAKSLPPKAQIKTPASARRLFGTPGLGTLYSPISPCQTMANNESTQKLQQDEQTLYCV